MPPPFSPTRETSVATAINLVKLNTVCNQYTRRGARFQRAVSPLLATSLAVHARGQTISPIKITKRARFAVPSRSFRGANLETRQCDYWKPRRERKSTLQNPNRLPTREPPKQNRETKLSPA